MTYRLADLLARSTPGEGGCVLWTGATTKDGYGVVRVAGRPTYVHRLRLILDGVEVGGLLVDHICRVRRCIARDHLRAVDARTNAVENSTSPSAVNAAATSCSSGHPLDGTYRRASGRVVRYCQTCARAKSRRAYRKALA